jgi:hypothetical protein
MTEALSNRALQLRLKKTLKVLLKPLKLKDLVITRADREIVCGILLTACPIERTVSGRDFEVGLSEGRGGQIRYVSVDGRRLLAARAGRRRTKAAK